LHGDLLGKVELRRPTLQDRIFPIAYSQPKGAFGVETVAALRPRVPGTYKVKADIEVQNYFGATLRRESRVISVAGAEDTTWNLAQKSPTNIRPS
jgi:hypothetical protein